MGQPSPDDDTLLDRPPQVAEANLPISSRNFCIGDRFALKSVKGKIGANVRVDRGWGDRSGFGAGLA
jgi:hypothetical protein